MIASTEGPKSPTTRHVLLTLSLHMDKEGGSCFPSTKTLSVETGLSERVICQHLTIATNDRWINRSLAHKSGQAWKRNQYQAILPKALTESQCVTPEGTDRESAPYDEGTDFECKKALTQGQSSISIELTNKHIVEIITYLNSRTGKNFKASTKQTQKHINARWRDGFRIDDFKRVIDNKVKVWMTDSKMSAYLRPETLFGPKFEAYLNEAPTKPQSEIAPKEFDFENQFKSS